MGVHICICIYVYVYVNILHSALCTMHQYAGCWILVVVGQRHLGNHYIAVSAY